MNKTRMFFFSIFLGTSFVSLFAANKYTLEDLNVLAENREYAEFFNHAKDVLPSKRNKVWRELVTKQAQSYVDDLRTKKDFELSSWKMVEKLSSWSQLKYDDFFQSKEVVTLDFSLSTVLQITKKECV